MFGIPILYCYEGNAEMNKKINIWTDLAELIEDQLNLQVKMQFKHHHQFMMNNGLGECHSVMDIGTGNGAFLAALAKKHPDISFIGVDDKEYMIDEASKAGIRNVKCHIGDLSQPKTIPEIDNADGILMRYVLLHLQDASSAIHKLYSALNDNARLWIIDLDLEHYQCKPENEAFELIKDLVRKFCDAHGKDCNIGSKLVGLLRKAGFTSIEQETEPLNTETVDIAILQKFIRQEVIGYNAALQNILTNAEQDKIMSFIDNLPSSGTFLNYGVTLVSAAKG